MLKEKEYGESCRLCYFVSLSLKLKTFGALPLTKPYSGVRCAAGVTYWEEWMSRYVLMCSLRDVRILYVEGMEYSVHICCTKICAALAMQYRCWKCLDNSLCLKVYSLISFWMFLLQFGYTALPQSVFTTIWKLKGLGMNVENLRNIANFWI